MLGLGVFFEVSLSLERCMSAPRPTRPTADLPPPSGARLRGWAFALLGRKEWSRQALHARLLSTGADPQEVDTLLTELVASDYQSDARTASMTVRTNVRKGRGPARIRQDLKTRALDPSLAADDLAETDWLAVAVALREKKFGVALPTDRKEQARQLRFLQYRGFDGDTCRKTLRYCADDDAD
jgi:regulatory protein